MDLVATSDLRGIPPSLKEAAIDALTAYQQQGHWSTQQSMTVAHAADLVAEYTKKSIPVYNKLQPKARRGYNHHSL